MPRLRRSTPLPFVAAAALVVGANACVLDSVGTGPGALPLDGGGGAGGASVTSAAQGGGGGLGGGVATTSGGGQGGTAGAGGAGGMGACGDGELDDGEECDDGDTDPGDGCSPICTNEGGLGCPGEVVNLPLGATTIPGTTVGHTGTTLGSCGGGSAPEQLYEVWPAVTGTLSAKLSALYVKPILYAKSTCEVGPELACSALDVPTLSVIVKAGVPVTLGVDGSAGTQGPFDLQLSLSVCGDGDLDAGEQCDDGNATLGDGCEGCLVTCACPGCSGVIEWLSTGDLHCYRLVSGDDRSWSEARVACQAWGGDLSALSTTNEIDLVKGVVIAPGDGDVWLGGTDSGNEGSFSWVNGEPYIFGGGGSPWATLEPNDFLFGEDCIEAYDDGKLNDETCSKKQDYLCERVPQVGPPP